MAEGLDTLFITGGIDAAAFGADPANPDKGLLEAWLAEKQTVGDLCDGASALNELRRQGNIITPFRASESKNLAQRNCAAPQHLL